MMRKRTISISPLIHWNSTYCAIVILTEIGLHLKYLEMIDFLDVVAHLVALFQTVLMFILSN